MKYYSELIKKEDINKCMYEAMNPTEFRLPDESLLRFYKDIGGSVMRGACDYAEEDEWLDIIVDSCYELGVVMSMWYDISDYELKTLCIEHSFDEDKKAIPYTIVFYTEPEELPKDEYDVFFACDFYYKGDSKNYGDPELNDAINGLDNIVRDVKGLIAEIDQASGI